MKLTYEIAILAIDGDNVVMEITTHEGTKVIQTLNWKKDSAAIEVNIDTSYPVEVTGRRYKGMLIIPPVKE